MSITRRAFVRSTAAGLAGLSAACIPRIDVRSPYVSAIPDVETSTLVNDLHSQLNPTTVHSIVKAPGLEAAVEAVRQAKASGRAVALAGGRHAMGGQQFGEDAVLIDTRALDRIVAFDREAGTVTMEGGVQWPQLLAYLDAEQAREPEGQLWGIIQKQTGADRLSIGGALACNAHGRGLALKPIVEQVRWFDLIDAEGRVVRCSRDEHRELFGLAIGGYGLFGIVARVQLQLRPRVKVRRVVELAETSGIIDRFEERIAAGYLYGDYQFTTDSTRDSFLRRGVFSTYQHVPDDTPLTENPARFNPEDWARLTFYAHRHKRRAFEVYSTRYLATSGQIYWADSQLSAAYVDDYHADIDRALGSRVKATEMITEIYVQRPRLAAFMEAAAAALRRRGSNVVYGTVRMIEKDDETFLPWARDRYACIIFNLHVEHSARAIEAAADAFRELIDLGLAHGGSYYLTYHRWARQDQVERCYPRMREFLWKKREYDPEERFQSTWYRHYRAMFA
jgi:FAD/FMN-containing dehydrogenase